MEYILLYFSNTCAYSLSNVETNFATYNSVFQFLAGVKRSLWALQSIRLNRLLEMEEQSDLSSSSLPLQDLSLPLGSKEHRLQLLRSWLLYFTTTVHGYFMSRCSVPDKIWADCLFLGLYTAQKWSSGWNCQKQQTWTWFSRWPAFHCSLLQCSWLFRCTKNTWTGSTTDVSSIPLLPCWGKQSTWFCSWELSLETPLFLICQSILALCWPGKRSTQDATPFWHQHYRSVE